MGSKKKAAEFLLTILQFAIVLDKVEKNSLIAIFGPILLTIFISFLTWCWFIDISFPPYAERVEAQIFTNDICT